jgi:DNA-binding transcriptional ArsR family regulator
MHCYVCMGLLFKALSSASRLRLLRHLGHGDAGVTALVEASGLAQPLVSQHLRVLRAAGLVEVDRVGREAIYSVADRHVSHIVDDAVERVGEALRLEVRAR